MIKVFHKLLAVKPNYKVGFSPYTHFYNTNIFYDVRELFIFFLNPVGMN